MGLLSTVPETISLTQKNEAQAIPTANFRNFS